MRIKIITCAISVLTIFSIGFLTTFKISELKTASVQTVTTKEPSIYVLKNNNGKLAVFSEDNELLYEYDFNVYSLPEKDIEILNKGLVVEGLSNLRSAIEDYTS